MVSDFALYDSLYAAAEIIHQPPHPTRSAFVRATTLSLGSIAFGSLIVTILELIRLLLRAVRDNAEGDNRKLYITS